MTLEKAMKDFRIARIITKDQKVLTDAEIKQLNPAKTNGKVCVWNVVGGTRYLVSMLAFALEESED